MEKFKSVKKKFRKSRKSIDDLIEDQIERYTELNKEHEKELNYIG